MRPEIKTWWVTALMLAVLLLPAVALQAQPHITVTPPVLPPVAVPQVTIAGGERLAAPGAPGGLPSPYPYPFIGLNLSDVMQYVERLQTPAPTQQDEYTIVRNGQEIPIFSSRRSSEDSYEVYRSNDTVAVGTFQAQADGRVRSYRLGPDVVNVLFNAGRLSAAQFADRFARLHRIPRWEVQQTPTGPAWQYRNNKQGYQVTIYADKSLAVDPLP